MRADLTCVLSPHERGQQLAHPRAERDAELGRQLIPAQQWLGRTSLTPLQRVVEHPSSQVDVHRDRLLGFRPARGKPIAYGQQRYVNLHRLACVRVVVDLRAPAAGLVHEKAEAQVVAHQRRDMLAQTHAGAQASEHLPS